MRNKLRLALSVAVTASLIALVTGCSTVGDVGKAPAAGASASAGAAGTAKKFRIATVSKIEGITWFQRMSAGVVKFDGDNKGAVQAWQTGPDTADPAKQIAIVEDLIAQGVDAIIVVPNDPKSMAPTLKKARDKGIIVGTTEAAALVGSDAIDFDIEAFDNVAFGEGFAKGLAKAMNGKGDYVGSVGSLTSESHMTWFKSAVAYLKKNFPDMHLVKDQPYENNNDDAKARASALEIVNAYPKLAGFLGTTPAAGSGMASVLKEKKITTIANVSLSLPSVAGPDLEAGWMSYAQTWDPAGWGYALNAVALAKLNKKEVATGADLGYDGYNSVTVNGQLILGNATMELSKGKPAAPYAF